MRLKANLASSTLKTLYIMNLVPCTFDEGKSGESMKVENLLDFLVCRHHKKFLPYFHVNNIVVHWLPEFLLNNWGLLRGWWESE